MLLVICITLPLHLSFLPSAPPLSPVVVRGDIQSRSVNITVTPPFSHFPITHYIVRVNETGQADTVVMNFTGNSVTVPGLSPFTDYTLTVVGVSRAGIGDPSNVVTFMTIEDGVCMCVFMHGILYLSLSPSLPSSLPPSLPSSLPPSLSEEPSVFAFQWWYWLTSL